MHTPTMLALSLVALVMGSPPGHAQDRCADVLASAYDVRLTRIDYKSRDVARTQTCSSRKTATSANGTLVFDNLRGEFGGNRDEENAYCNGTLNINEVTNRVDQKIWAVHDTVIQSWKDCMTQKGGGPRVSLTPTSDPFTVNLSLSYTDPKNTQARLKKWSVENLSCEDRPLEGAMIGQLVILTCKRNPAQYTQINLTFDDVASPPTQSMAALPPPPADFSPAQIASDYSTDGLGHLMTFQEGKVAGWRYDEAAVKHYVSGTFVSPTKIIALQRRIDQAHCISFQVLRAEIVGPTLVVSGRMEPPGSRQCGISDEDVRGPSVNRAVR